jgi:hypothetical protein
MAAIGREGGESRSAAARVARVNRVSDREVPLPMSRDGLADMRKGATRMADHTNLDVSRRDATQ